MKIRDSLQPLRCAFVELENVYLKLCPLPVSKVPLSYLGLLM